MTSPLRAWLALYAPASAAKGAAASDCDALQTVLRLAFPSLSTDAPPPDTPSSPAADTWHSIVYTLEAFFEMPLGVDASQLRQDDATGDRARTRVSEFALAAAVQSAQRADFVRAIQTLDDDVQAALVAAIERVLALQQRASSDDQVLQAPTDAATRSVHASLERTRRENAFLQDENVRVTQQLETATQSLATAAAENATLVDAVRELQLQLEVDGLRRERSIRAQFDERIRTLEAALAAAHSDAETLKERANEATALRDDVDVLRPVAERVEKTEAALVKYKARVEELLSVHEKLRRLEVSNAELVARNLSMEAQVGKTASLQRKLVEAKDANTAVEFRVADLQAQLTRQDAKLTRTRQERAAAQHALEEATALINQLQREAGESGNEATATLAATTLAGGVSEFNPELMHQLARLQFENDALRTRVDGATSERVEQLRDALDDVTRLKQSFETRYFDAAQQLQQQCEHIAQLESDASAAERERQQLEDTVARLDARCAEQTTTLACRDADIRALNNTVDELRGRVDATARHATELTRANAALETRVSERTVALATATADADDLARQTVALSLLFTATFEAHDELQRVSQQRLEREDALTHALDAARAELSQVQAAYCRDVASLQSTHSGSLARMTDAVSAKAAYIEELTAQTRALREAQRASDAARDAVERELRAQLAQLETRLQDATAHWTEQRRQCDAREAALQQTIRDQLASNQQLMATNHARTRELRRTAAECLQLEDTTTRLESKVLVLERERAHVTAQADRTREAEADEASLSAQLAAQVALVVAELEQVQSEYAVVRAQVLATGGCPSQSPSTVVGSGKASYADRIRQLEQAKHDEASKRRALLLVNARLLQEQRQAHKTHTAAVAEMQRVRDKLNRWRLRDERRRRESDAMRCKLEALEATHRLVVAEAANTVERHNSVLPDESPGPVSASTQPTTVDPSVGTAPLRSPSNADGGCHPETQAQTASSVVDHCVDENRSRNVDSDGRKRKFDDVEEHAETSPSVDELEKNGDRWRADSVTTSTTTHPTTKRSRVPLYVVHSDPPTLARDDDKPSECQQQ